MQRPIFLYFVSSFLMYATNLTLVAVAPVVILPLYIPFLASVFNMLWLALTLFKNTHPAIKILLTMLASLCWIMRYIALRRLVCALHPLPPSLSHFHPLPPLRVHAGASS